MALSQKERDQIDDSDFAGPDQSFPIDSQEHLDAAAHLIGHAADPAAVKKKAIAIAKRKGFTLPKSWQDEEKQRMDEATIIRADGSHDPFSGSHSHAHPAFGSQGGDENHAHEHSHDGDADHHHTHADRADEPDILRSMPAELQLYAPIIRIDREKREVVVRATSEALDTYGTVFDYEASKEAFSKWRGNIREMHDSTKAVGRAVQWIPNDQERAIDVTLRVSRGAEDTWQKVLDGTLAGASIGAKKGIWEKRAINGKEVPVLAGYNLVELSLVDNPSNPDANIMIVRADGVATEIIDDTPDESQQNSQPTDTRAGKAISAATAGKAHQSMIHSLQAAKTSADMCNCPACQAVSLALDPDQDGDIDIVPELDTDSDQGGAGDVEASLKPTIVRIIEQALQPTVQRYGAIAALLAQNNTAPDITRRLDEVAGLKSELTEVRSALAKVQETTESYANRAQSGGPVVNTGNMRGAAPAPMQPQQLAAQYAPFVELLIKQGIIQDHNAQIEANLLVQKIANGG